MTPVQRFITPSYSDGLQAPRRSVQGQKLPSAREISSLIHESQNVESSGITHLLMQWGQFIDHDVTSSSQTRGFNGSVPRCCKDGGRDFVPREFMHPECMPISVPSSDPFYGPKGVRCLDFVRSSPAPHDDCSLGWREQLNQVSAYIDASPIYGSSARKSDKLRLFRNGMLQYGRVQQRRPLLPKERRDELCRGGALSTDCFKSGDARVNEHPGLVAAHILWLRQHNRMAQELAHVNPHWSDEKIYQEARKIVGAMVQHITYKEFLPIVLGTEVMRLFDLEPQRKGYYKSYNPKINPNPASSFGSAAFRFGHSLVQPSMIRFDRFHRPMNNNVSLHDELTNPSNIWSMGAVDRLVLGMVNQPIQKRDEYITEELTNHLFQTPQFDFGMDLAAINIQRGRDHGVPAYTSFREPCGLTPMTEFEDLFRVMPARTVRKLQTVYRHVDDIDLFTGGMAERPVVGGLVGPTFACIIAQQFSNLRKGDRFWYENGGFESSFTPAQLQQIRRISLAQILCRTLDNIDSVQPFAFLSADNPDNDRLPCNSGLMNNFDLSPWEEISDNDIAKSDKHDILTQTPKPKPSTTTKPNLKQSKPTIKAPIALPLVTNIKEQNNKHTRLNKTENKMTLTQTKFNNVRIDDKLDFKNKSKRYEDSDRQDDRQNRPTKTNYNDYDEDDVQSVQSVVINNVGHKRPQYNRPIAVTENIDKFTYLINYVPRPRPTQSWRQTTRRPYTDRDVVKVTYQSYDDTYRRPNRPYDYNNRRDERPSNDYRQNKYTTKTNDYHSSARSNDEILDSEETTAQKSTSTENVYKLVTFGYVGTYKGTDATKSDFKLTDKDKNDFKSDFKLTDNDKNDFKLTDKDKNDFKSDFKLTDNDKNYFKFTDKHKNDFKFTDKDKNDFKFTDKDKNDFKLTDNDKNDFKAGPNASKDFVTHDKENSKIPKRDMDDKMKISTFYHYETVTKPFTMPRSTRRDDEMTLLDSFGSSNKYYYAGNVLHRYPDIDSTLTNKPTVPDEERENIKENYNNPGHPIIMDVQERSADKLVALEDNSPKTATRTQIKKKQPPKVNSKTPSVDFQVMPSEISPTHWAVYEENENLPESLHHKMPSIQADPYELKEMPRPMSFGLRMKKRRPSS